jgi:hypothetical protein
VGEINERKNNMITLWDGYCITADAFNYVLGIPTTSVRKGEEEESMRDATYHGTLGEALRAFYRKQLRESIRNKEYTLSTAFAEASAIEERIRALAAEPDFTERTN